MLGHGQNPTGPLGCVQDGLTEPGRGSPQLTLPGPRLLGFRAAWGQGERERVCDTPPTSGAQGDLVRVERRTDRGERREEWTERKMGLSRERGKGKESLGRKKNERVWSPGLIEMKEKEERKEGGKEAKMWEGESQEIGEAGIERSRKRGGG